MTFAAICSLALVCASAADAQRVIKATSKVVDIVDGEHDKRGAWYVFPERRPDSYYVSSPRTPHRVMFRTDRDSIAFVRRYGEVYDFIILLKEQHV